MPERARGRKRSRPDSTQPDPLALGIALAAQIDFALDRPPLVALWIDEGLEDVPAARACGLDQRALRLRRNRGEKDARAFVEIRLQRVREAIGGPRILGVVQQMIGRIGCVFGNVRSEAFR